MPIAMYGFIGKKITVLALPIPLSPLENDRVFRFVITTGLSLVINGESLIIPVYVNHPRLIY